MPGDTKDYLSVDDDNKDKNDIGNCFNQSKSLLKTLPGNAIDNHLDKLEAEKVAFADLGSCPGGINRRETAVVFRLELE